MQIDNYLGFSSFVVPEEDEEEGTFFADIKRMKVTPPKGINVTPCHSSLYFLVYPLFDLFQIIDISF